MAYKSIKGFSGTAQLGFLFVFLGLGVILGVGVQSLIALKMIPPGTPMADMENAMLTAIKDPRNLSYARLLQVLTTFFLLFVPAILYSWVSNGRNKFWLGFNPYISIFQVLLGFLIIFTAGILSAPLAELSKTIIAHFPSFNAYAGKLENMYNEQALILSNLKSWPEFFMAIAIMAFFPALFEEVFFRGAMQTLFVKWWKKPLLAIIVTSLIFSIVHGSAYLFLSRAMLGFVLGLMYHNTKNLWVNVIAHFLNNVIAVIQLFSMNRSKEKMDISKLDVQVEWWYGIIAIGVLFFLFRFLERYSIKNRYKINAKEQLLMAESNSNPFAKTEMNELGNQ